MEEVHFRFPNPITNDRYLPGSYRFWRGAKYREYLPQGTHGSEKIIHTVPVKKENVSSNVKQMGIRSYKFKVPRFDPRSVDKFLPRGGAIMRVVGADNSEDPVTFNLGQARKDEVYEPTYRLPALLRPAGPTGNGVAQPASRPQADAQLRDDLTQTNQRLPTPDPAMDTTPFTKSLVDAAEQVGSSGPFFKKETQTDPQTNVIPQTNDQIIDNQNIFASLDKIMQKQDEYVNRQKVAELQNEKLMDITWQKLEQLEKGTNENDRVLYGKMMDIIGETKVNQNETKRLIDKTNQKLDDELLEIRQGFNATTFALEEQLRILKGVNDKIFETTSDTKAKLDKLFKEQKDIQTTIAANNAQIVLFQNSINQQPNDVQQITALIESNKELTALLNQNQLVIHSENAKERQFMILQCQNVYEAILAVAQQGYVQDGPPSPVDTNADLGSLKIKYARLMKKLEAAHFVYLDKLRKEQEMLNQQVAFYQNQQSDTQQSFAASTVDLLNKVNQAFQILSTQLNQVQIVQQNIQVLNQQNIDQTNIDFTNINFNNNQQFTQNNAQFNFTNQQTNPNFTNQQTDPNFKTIVTGLEMQIAKIEDQIDDDKREKRDEVREKREKGRKLLERRLRRSRSPPQK
jgi:hypothetical protein